jgi:hypothetical protein
LGHRIRVIGASENRACRGFPKVLSMLWTRPFFALIKLEKGGFKAAADCYVERMSQRRNAS